VPSDVDGRSRRISTQAVKGKVGQGMELKGGRILLRWLLMVDLDLGVDLGGELGGDLMNGVEELFHLSEIFVAGRSLHAARQIDAIWPNQP
jgi:hypothetical protein